MYWNNYRITLAEIMWPASKIIQGEEGKETGECIDKIRLAMIW